MDCKATDFVVGDIDFVVRDMIHRFGECLKVQGKNAALFETVIGSYLNKNKSPQK